MGIDEAVGILWDSLQQSSHYPAVLQGKLTPEEGYQAQLGILRRFVASGNTQAGWKIGLSAAAIRSMYKVKEPVFGYLLERDSYPNGASFAIANIVRPAIESELCFTLSKTLRGPGITREMAAEAVASVAPAFEIVSFRGDMAADLPLGLADNVSQWGYVIGDAVAPYPQGLVLGEVVAEVLTNGATIATLRGAEVIDDQLQSLAWLANALSVYGVELEAGQRVITGSFNKPLPLKPGEQWEARFSAIGSVSAAFV